MNQTRELIQLKAETESKKVVGEERGLFLQPDHLLDPYHCATVQMCQQVTRQDLKLAASHTLSRKRKYFQIFTTKYLSFS